MTSLPRPNYTGELPIHQSREAIIAALKRHQALVIAGETGSGKTTQIPKFLLECGLGQKGWIGCTQPRRVAALSVGQRIAEELNVPFGREVGSKIRFTDNTQAETVLKVMTDGILLNEIQDDPLLRNYEAIVIDEAHERSLNIDFILGCLRQLIRRREDLKVVITSATIDTDRFSKAFDDAPVIEVSGRMFPVTTHYRPVEMLAGERRDADFLDAAAEVIEEILRDNREGDILVFLPGERDIHELRRLLEGTPARQCDLLPLFGRLSNADQQRIFHPGGRRRIILSTNIAETSLTVPEIRFVVDSGLARVSRYSPHSRTQRLPIEAVAQSSADQRKGRCGRVSDGNCYRLYSEEDYLGRAPYTTPEIHRSNLASVILRMMAFRLGDIRSFPFIDPPSDGAIVGGYRVLAELGAVTSEKESPGEDDYRLTTLGRRLSRLPVDPTVGRILLQAETEGCLAPVLVIASGLSIQDPRERPAEVAKEADAMHQRFIHPDSDFLTLLNIWNAYHEKLETLSQNKLRKFCKAHFLAYQRMREWRDIHQQISRLMNDRNRSKATEKRERAGQSANERPTDAAYAAIHRSVLAGLLSNIARKESGHDYRGPRNRKAMLFPGSGLFDQQAAKKQRKAAYAKKTKAKPAKTSAPDWIVCGEWMETSQLFARTAAKIEVDWVMAMAGDLIRVRYSEPFWSSRSAAVLCRERRLLFGLELVRNEVSYSQIAPEAATDIFVRNGLVEAGIAERPDFLKENIALQERAESEVARRRIGNTFLVEDRLDSFYRARLSGVGSFAELRRFAKKHHNGSMDFLKARLSDLVPPDASGSETDFPPTIQLGGREIPLHYRNEPGNDADGVSMRVPLAQVAKLQEGVLDWAVPGYLEDKIESLLRALPKALRVQLHPLKERAAELRTSLQPSDAPLWDQLRERLKNDYAIQTYRDQWQVDRIPSRLRPRIQVENDHGEVVAESRDLMALQEQLKARAEAVSGSSGHETLPAWQEAAARLERENLNGTVPGDLPKRIDLSGASGLPLAAYPALVLDREQVHLRLLPDQAAAEQATLEAWPHFCEKAAGREAAWLQRDLRDLKGLGPDLLPLGGYEAIKGQAWAHLRRHLYACPNPLPLRQATLEKILSQAENERRGLTHRLCDRLRQLLAARAEVALLLEQKKTNQAIRYPGMQAQLEAIAPGDLLDRYEFRELPDLTRFLRGMMLRARRARESVQKDMEKAERIAPFEAKLTELAEQAAQKRAIHLIKPYRMLLEEFKISVFAQEIGTGQKVSEKRLEALAGKLGAALRSKRIR